MGGDGDDGDDKEKEEEAERERLEAIREAEERRKEKHRKMEEEREKMRQEIRDKVCEIIFYFLERARAKYFTVNRVLGVIQPRSWCNFALGNLKKIPRSGQGLKKMMPPCLTVIKKNGV